MEAEVTAAAAETSNRRRLMFNGKSGLAMMPSCERRAGASASLPCYRPHPLAGTTLPRIGRLVRAARALVLMRAGGWNGEKKGVKCPWSVPRVKSPEEGGSAKRPRKRVRSSLAMFLTA